MAGRLSAHFSVSIKLTPELAKTPECNIIKLPNISASIPKLLECIVELQAKGYHVPDYPANTKNAEDETSKAIYSVPS